jgi:hypothetical protein
MKTPLTGTSPTDSLDNAAFYIVRKRTSTEEKESTNNYQNSFGSTDSYDIIYSVDYSGRLLAKKADIEGKITANTGTIGGWTIGTQYSVPAIYNASGDKILALMTGGNGINKSIKVNDKTISDKYWRLWFADANGIGKFCVATDGTMFASDVNIEGNVIASAGKIGGWTVKAPPSSGTSYSGGIYYCTDNINDKYY